MGINLQTIEYYSLDGGMNDNDADTSLNENEWSFVRNADNLRDGSIATRLGCTRLHKTPINSNAQFLLDFYYQFDDGTNDRLIVCGDKLYKFNNAVFTLIGAGFSTQNYWSATQLGNRVILCNGVDDNRQWDGTTLSLQSIYSAPQDNADTFTTAVGVGGKLQVGTFQYAYTYRNPVTLEESNPVQILLSGQNIPLIKPATTTAVNKTVTLTNFIPSGLTGLEIVIYRSTYNSLSPLYEIATKPDTAALFVDAGILDGTRELEYDNDLAPKSGMVATFLNRTYYAVGDKLYYSKPFLPSSVPVENFYRVGRDGQAITCLLTIGNNSLLIGKTRSNYILPDDPFLGAVPQAFNTVHGILNNRSATVLDNSVFFIDQSIRPYVLDPTELANRERRVHYIGRRLSSTFDSISKDPAAIKHIKCETVTIENRKQWLVSIPLTSTTKTDAICVLDLMAPPSPDQNELGAWYVWTKLSASTLKVWPDTDGIPRLYRGDFNGFMWRHFITYGDGAQINSTSTGSNTNSTLNDTTQTWTANDFIGVDVLITEGLGKGQRSTITSNTGTQLVVSPAWVTVPNATSQYSIGGIDFQVFTNWKRFLSHDDVKRLWFLWFNFSKSGSYAAKLYIQKDFDTSLLNALTLTILTSITNSLWGYLIWGQGLWGGLTSVREKIQTDLYFNHLRLGIINQNAGQPIVLNGFSISAQGKGLFQP